MTAQNDLSELSALNAQFIKNFITEDATSHAKIIHEDFVCVESDGGIVDRETYLKNWATDYTNSGCRSFTYADEFIRLFGDIALVRARTTAVRQVNGETRTDQTIYIDTYKKENGKWRCIQVQITPVK